MILLLAVAILLALCWGWLYWGWKNEQAALRKMRLEPLMHVAPLGGDMASQSLGSAGWVLNRVRSMRCLVIRNDGDMVCLKDFKWIDTLDLGGAPITDAGLVHLSDSKRLQELILQRTRITDAGLVHLGALKELRELVLWQTEVTPEGVGKLQATLPGAHISGP